MWISYNILYVIVPQIAVPDNNAYIPGTRRRPMSNFGMYLLQARMRRGIFRGSCPYPEIPGKFLRTFSSSESGQV